MRYWCDGYHGGYSFYSYYGYHVGDGYYGHYGDGYIEGGGQLSPDTLVTGIKLEEVVLNAILV